MGTVGNFGGIKFYTKLKNGRPDILSFRDLNWSSSINVEEHKRYHKKPFLEFIDRNADELNLEIYLSAYLNQSPMKKYLKLRKYCLYAKAFPFVLGGERLGSFKFVITNISNVPTEIYKNGKVVAAKVAVTFKEWPYKAKKSKKTKTNSSNGVAGKGIKKNGSKKGTSKKSTSKKKASKKDSTKGYSSYTVKKGDTLWGLAKKYYGSGGKYRKIYNANKSASKGFDKISNPNVLKPGMKIKIPK